MSALLNFKRTHTFERTHSLPNDLHTVQNIQFGSGGDDEVQLSVDQLHSGNMPAAMDFQYGIDAFLHTGNEFYRMNSASESEGEDNPAFDFRQFQLEIGQKDFRLPPKEPVNANASRLVWSKPLTQSTPHAVMPRSQSAQSLNTRYVDSNPAVHREQPVNTSQNRVKMSEIQTMQTLQETVDTPVPATTGNRELFPFASILISSSSSSYHNDGVLSDDGMADVRRRKRFNRPSGNASDGDDGFAPTPQAMIEQAVNNPVLTQTESDSDDALDADYSSGARRRLRRSVLKGFVPNQGVTQSQPAFTPREREPSVVAPIQPELDDKKIKRQRTVGQAVPREMSRVERESARKRRHNIVEQNRRILVNHTLDQLRHIIPTLNNKTPKAITLFSTVEYIKKILEDQGNMKAQLQSIDVPLPKECFESPPPPSTIGAPAAVPIKKSSLETSPKNLPKPAPAPLVMSKDKEPISAPATPKNAAYTNPMPLRVVQLRSENVVANPLTFNDRGAVSIGPAGAVRRSVSVPDGLSSWQHPPRKVMPQVSVTVPLPTAAARRDIDANQHVHHDVTLAAELKAASPVRLAPESRHRNVVEASGRVAVARDDGEDDDDDEFVVVD